MEALILLEFFVQFAVFVGFETESYYVANAGLELIVLLPRPPECWDFRHVLLAIIKNNIATGLSSSPQMSITPWGK